MIKSNEKMCIWPKWLEHEVLGKTSTTSNFIKAMPEGSRVMIMKLEVRYTHKHPNSKRKVVLVVSYQKMISNWLKQRINKPHALVSRECLKDTLWGGNHMFYLSYF